MVLNRLIKNLNSQGVHPYIFSNHPNVTINEGNIVADVVINTLNCAESSSWCARSWNSIFLKAFAEHGSYGLVCFQDDTDVKSGFVEHLIKCANDYDFISAPAGDQFFYMSLDVLKMVGWFDERYIGCYCGDADFFKRVYLNYNKDRVSNVDTHNWGWVHNDCKMQDFLDTEFNSKMCQPGYDNQHWELERLNSSNSTLIHSQNHYRAKWITSLDCGQPAINHSIQVVGEIDWYPWASKKLGFMCKW